MTSMSELIALLTDMGFKREGTEPWYIRKIKTVGAVRVIIGDDEAGEVTICAFDRNMCLEWKAEYAWAPAMVIAKAAECFYATKRAELIPSGLSPAEEAVARTEIQIIEALRANGKWMRQSEIRRVTGLPLSRVESFTLSMALEGKIDRTLSDDHRTQLFRAKASS